MLNKKLIILGTRGIPAQHGGFETFAEKLSQHLVKNGWCVTVYCQVDGNGPITKSIWDGIDLINIPVDRPGASGTMLFDWHATRHALSQDGLFLLLGYNTAAFNIIQRIKGQTLLINMDGIEWRRDKWGFIAKSWFWLNERAGCWIGNHLIADHPSIKDHLATRVKRDKITMIPYGADEVVMADASLLHQYNLAPNDYSIVIARPEPENSFFEMVTAFSSKRRNHNLVVLGNFQPSSNPYHKRVMDAASEEVIFPGAIYEPAIVQALRYFCRLYLHGHRVGGTNPSLVEALGAGCAVIAHDNLFNRWVSGPDSAFFKDELECSDLLDTLLSDSKLTDSMKQSSRTQFKNRFTWQHILTEYETLLNLWNSKR